MMINMSNIIAVLLLFLLPLLFILLVSPICITTSPFGATGRTSMPAPTSWTGNSPSRWRAMPLRMQVHKTENLFLFIFMHLFAYLSPPSGQQVLFLMNSISPAEGYYKMTLLNLLCFVLVAILYLHLQIQFRLFYGHFDLVGSV